MSFKRFIENFNISNNELEAYLVSRLVISNQGNILQNTHLAELSLNKLWIELSAREKVSLLQSREIPSSFRKTIISREKSIIVISSLLDTQNCDADDIDKLIQKFGLKLRDKLYLHCQTSKESKIALSKLKLDKFYLNEVINNNIIIETKELTSLLSSEKIMYNEKNLIAKAYLLNNNFRDCLANAKGTENMIFFASSPFLDATMLSNILNTWNVNLEASKFILLGLLGNPLMPIKLKKKLHEDLLHSKPCYWDYELENQINGMLSNAYEITSYTAILDEESKNRLLKRILPSRFKPEGRVLDMVALSFNENLTAEELEPLSIELDRVRNFSMYTENIMLPETVDSIPAILPVKLDYEKNINVLSNSELTQLSIDLEYGFGNDLLKWETLLALYPEYNGDVATLVSLAENV